MPDTAAPLCQECDRRPRWSVGVSEDGGLDEARVVAFACGRHLHGVLAGMNTDDLDQFGVYPLWPEPLYGR